MGEYNLNQPYVPEPLQWKGICAVCGVPSSAILIKIDKLEIHSSCMSAYLDKITPDIKPPKIIFAPPSEKDRIDRIIEPAKPQVPQTLADTQIAQTFADPPVRKTLSEWLSEVMYNTYNVVSAKEEEKEEPKPPRDIKKRKMMFDD